MDFNNWYLCLPIYCLVPPLSTLHWSHVCWWSVEEFIQHFTQTVIIRWSPASVISAFERLVWDYKKTKTNSENIKKSIETVNWEAMFGNKVHEQVNIFHKISMNIFSNFVPNKKVIFDNKDPPWMQGRLNVFESEVGVGVGKMFTD